MSRLLSRYAESVFWLARQIERADSLARILDVNASFSHDSSGSHNWESIVTLYSARAEFLKRHDAFTADAVLHFYLLDRTNPCSIASAVALARENARALRPLISTEMWGQLNSFNAKMKRLRRPDIAEPKLAKLCGLIKQECQTHFGIVGETFYRDEAWLFYEIGQNIERADQTTRLLDVKYHLLLPPSAGIGSPLDVSQWGALLRSAAGFHAYRRLHPTGMSPVRVADFLLFDRHFPRSILRCLDAAVAALAEMRATYDLHGGGAAERQLTNLRDRVAGDAIESVISRGLHETLDWIQIELLRTVDELGYAYFGVRPETTGDESSQSQSQSQIAAAV